MPTIRGIPGPYRFYFYSLDCDEKMHVHVRRDSAWCKFWLSPIVLSTGGRFSRRELAAIRRIIFEHQAQIVEAWREHCSEAE